MAAATAADDDGGDEEEEQQVAVAAAAADAVADGADEQISLTLKLPLALARSLSQSLFPPPPPRRKLAQHGAKNGGGASNGAARLSACTSKAAASQLRSAPLCWPDGLGGMDRVRQRTRRTELCRR